MKVTKDKTQFTLRIQISAKEGNRWVKRVSKPLKGFNTIDEDIIRLFEKVDSHPTEFKIELEGIRWVSYWGDNKEPVEFMTKKRLVNYKIKGVVA